jgi:hypothetical protein
MTKVDVYRDPDPLISFPGIAALHLAHGPIVANKKRIWLWKIKRLRCRVYDVRMTYATQGPGTFVQ